MHSTRGLGKSRLDTGPKFTSPAPITRERLVKLLKSGRTLSQHPVRTGRGLFRFPTSSYHRPRCCGVGLSFMAFVIPDVTPRPWLHVSSPRCQGRGSNERGGMTDVTIAPHVLVRNFHRSAWKVISAIFALLDFYTLRRIAG
jgi:hypothetical protein